MAKSFRCLDCGDVKKSKSDIKRHIQTFHVEKIKCPLCNRFFNRLDNFKRHLPSHQVDREVKDHIIKSIRVDDIIKHYQVLDPRNYLCPAVTESYPCVFHYIESPMYMENFPNQQNYQVQQNSMSMNFPMGYYEPGPLDGMDDLTELAGFENFIFQNGWPMRVGGGYDPWNDTPEWPMRM
ncbi:hypothetical protein DASC09_043210 [Saccharomycopsis crataegensis]|uniref:C2H2-type domain-containing protein n=1 Tax=Saccharomycopsis crataegensis TaxID=43959 RepID=A0AAV5QR19_9ASCO|nr:hypothetical protein DASC09_043210 [Saccharomycopsis crataegensis]